MPRAARKPVTEMYVDDDDTDPGRPVRRIVPAGAERPATNAPRSVFEQVTRAAVLAEVVIRKGVPLPDRSRGLKSRYRELIERMEVGDSIELPAVQARSFMACSKEVAAHDIAAGRTPKHFVFRTLRRPGFAGIWRDR